MSIFDSVTNINRDAFQFDNGNKGTIDAPTLARKAITPGAASVTLYSFDIKTGNASERNVVMPAIRVKDSFAPAFVGDWYRVQHEKAFDAKSKYDAAAAKEELSVDEKEAYSAIVKRYEIVRDILNAHEAGKTAACNTVKNFVACVAKLPAKAFSGDVTTAFEGVKTAYKDINKDKESVNLKSFREALQGLTTTLFIESNNCEHYVFNANKTLANEVYSIMYGGRKLDKDGNVIKGNAPDRVGISEVVYACLEALQNKVPAEPVDSVKPAEKKSGKKNANK